MLIALHKNARTTGVPLIRMYCKSVPMLSSIW